MGKERMIHIQKMWKMVDFCQVSLTHTYPDLVSPVLKGQVHPKIKDLVIIYSPHADEKGG